jgi:hypothetical protein
MTGVGAIAKVKAKPSGLGDEPVFAFGRERRMHARAYDYWVSLLNGRRMPCVRDMDQRKMAGFADRSVLVDLPEQGGAPVIAYLGEELRAECDIVAANPTIDDVAPGTLLAELLRRFSDIVVHEAPVGFEAEFAGRDDTRLLHRGILLPFSDDAGRLSAVYGVMSWKQVAAVEPAPDIMAAIGSVMAARASAPVVCAWGDGPGAASTAAESLPPQQPAQRLAQARTWAALAVTDRTRGDTSLHAALGAAYDYLLAIRDGTLTTRKLVRMVFGTDLRRIDRIRFAATLDHAIRLGMGPGRLPAWLDNHEGGHVAIAIAERHARRTERSAAQFGEQRDWVEAQAALGQIELAIDQDLMLLIGRRALRGVEVIAPVPADEYFTEAAVERARRAG